MGNNNNNNNRVGGQVQINYWIHLPIRIHWGERLGVPSHNYHICNVELPCGLQKDCLSKYQVPATATSKYRLCHADNKTKKAVPGCLVPALVIWVCACVRRWPKPRGCCNIKGAFTFLLIGNATAPVYTLCIEFRTCSVGSQEVCLEGFLQLSSLPDLTSVLKREKTK